MTIQVDSEVGRLRRVLVHRPGREVDWMVPDMMREHLFDDILDGEQARDEHERFCRVLERAGVEVVQAGRLLAEVLRGREAREEVLAAVEEHWAVAPEAGRRLADLEPQALAEALIQGIRAPGDVFVLDPVSNYLFQRDPQVVLGRWVVVSSMATWVRARESLLARILFRHHPALSGYSELFEIGTGSPAAAEPETSLAVHPTLEGGDVLVLGPETILVGLSARSNRRGVESLAEHLRSCGTTFRHLIVVEIPPRRSFMHLDTVFTVIDRQTCLAYPPVVEGEGREAATVYHVNLSAPELSFTLRGSLMDTLAELGWVLEVVPCGGRGDSLEQRREQWTDGANALAIGPGVILLYRRNRRTIEELARRGWQVLTDEEVLSGGKERMESGRVVVTFLGNELSRARGGPRCMTMPLERDPI